jgi:Mn2+/Fe2+ NRAMP family transporter
MKKIFEVTLGIVTSIGGFLEIGSLMTAAQGGSQFAYQLIWAIVLGVICIIFLVEMSGRFSAISRHTIPDAIRERFGFKFFFIQLLILIVVILLVLAAEIGGVCISLEMVTGIRFQWWAVPVGVLVWLILWKFTFGVIEKGVSLLGLVTICFVVAAIKLHPDIKAVAAGALPSLPSHDSARYWFIAVSIVGATISPYLMYFYSSGAIEDDWNENHLAINRVVSIFGMSFGGAISIAVLVVAAVVLLPRGIKVEHYQEAEIMLTDAFGGAGIVLFAASLGIACLGAALEIALQVAYVIAQGFGWNWGENQRPSENARFALVYTVTTLVASLIVLTGIEPLKLTVFSMALTAATLPLAIVPFLVLMNDKHYIRNYGNGWISNTAVLLIIGLAFVLAVVTIPLQFFGG